MATDILMIEDSRTFAEAAVAGLKAYHANFPNSTRYHVDVVGTVAEGRQRLLTRPYAALLLDLTLPNGEGVALVYELVTAFPDVAVVVLTGRDESMADAIIRAGAHEYLSKTDMTANNLERALKRAIVRHEVRHTVRPIREELAEIRSACDSACETLQRGGGK